MADEKAAVIVDVSGASYITEYDIRIRKTEGIANQNINNQGDAEKIILALYESLPSETWHLLADVAYKLEKYGANEFNVPVPPVSTANWETLDWIKYIDQNKGWQD